MSDDDYCVYARNILGRLNSISNPTTAFNADPTQQGSSSVTDNPANIGLIMIGFLILAFMILSLKMKPGKKEGESKMEE